MSAFTNGRLRAFDCLTINCSPGRRPFGSFGVAFLLPRSLFCWNEG